mmetsp:Transcript_28881/g.96856  ORF Transcript_28881/g.96856 Transcript_28881/m.96856 type:complete len:314 (+) Transcript_28881:513-1454(+)
MSRGSRTGGAVSTTPRTRSCRAGCPASRGTSSSSRRCASPPRGSTGTRSEPWARAEPSRGRSCGGSSRPARSRSLSRSRRGFCPACSPSRHRVRRCAGSCVSESLGERRGPQYHACAHTPDHGAEGDVSTAAAHASGHQWCASDSTPASACAFATTSSGGCLWSRRWPPRPLLSRRRRRRSRRAPDRWSPSSRAPQPCSGRPRSLRPPHPHRASWRAASSCPFSRGAFATPAPTCSTCRRPCADSLRWPGRRATSCRWRSRRSASRCGCPLASTRLRVLATTTGTRAPSSPTATRPRGRRPAAGWTTSSRSPC